MLTAVHFMVLLVVTAPVVGADWVRPGLNTNQPMWGLRGGLLWAVGPAGFRGGEPRGLIRLGYPVLAGSAGVPAGGIPASRKTPAGMPALPVAERYDLINFIAIEPIVGGHRGFSELERSQLDGVPGKRIWCESFGSDAQTNLVSGQLRKGPGGGEELEVGLRVEKFENGAHVRLVIVQRSDRPDEIQLSIFKEQDSAPLEYCILTATMGNMARTRELWLNHEVLNSRKLYPDYKDTGFAQHRAYPLSRLHRTTAGGVLVAVTNDEQDPASVYPFPNSQLWHYAGSKVTQYWAQEPGAVRNDLHAVVNARYTYWRSTRQIPEGVAFENFELQERFYEGQTFVFGITAKAPQELGLGIEEP